ncbi:MAG: ABC transporter permease [Actinomycetota bacterium]|nr:ABC transporter permease [Actinomycetota bacterium]
MNFVQLLRSALEAVRWNRLRSLLTILGIVIGIAAVMLTVGLGEGAQAKVAGEINALGSNLLVVTSSPFGSSSNGQVNLTMSDVKALQNHTVAPDLAQVVPIVTTSASLTYGTTSATLQIQGTTPSWLTARSQSLQAGRFLDSTDMANNADVVVLGATAAQTLFSGRNPVGQQVTVGSLPMTVVGVLSPVGSGTGAGASEDNLAIVPLTTSQSSLSGSTPDNSVQQIILKATGSSTLSAAYQEADQELLMLQGSTSASSANFTITAEQTIVNAATSVSSTLTALLAGIAGVSLLVGGIGVMNIMLVSVAERTREIGLRKAIGARRRDISRQFLAEATFLGFTGGALGVGLGMIGKVVLPKLLSDPISIPAWATGGAIVVAIVISLVFGVYPAVRAARLSPIDALRSE